MKITVKNGLPFIHITVFFRGRALKLDNVLLDSGSAGTIFNANTGPSS